MRDLEPYFVYVGTGRKAGQRTGAWRFVWYGDAISGDEAITLALREAEQLGAEVAPGTSYLAVPFSACTTREVVKP